MATKRGVCFGFIICFSYYLIFLKEDELDQDFVPQQNNQPHQFKLHDGSLSELAAAEDTNSWFSQSSRHSPSPELDRTQRGDGMHFQASLFSRLSYLYFIH